MKTSLKVLMITATFFAATPMFSQSKKDSLGLPGDNFDLYGALDLFKQAKNPEAFEKAINAKDNEVNNLDLDADGKVDYIKVVDKASGDAHSFVLQVAVSKTEVQDVAVIEVEKKGSDNAHVQIVGDEELYGKDYIIEPREQTDKAVATRPAAKNADAATDDVYRDSDDNTSNNNTGNNNSNNRYADNSGPVVINVWAWPSVQYIYGPAYVGWYSPYYWGYYPGWWDPWYPVYYPVYYRRVYRYHHPYYYRTSYYRNNIAHNYYYGRRSASETVRDRNRSGYYREKQSTYKNNPVHGRRYNNQPADRGKTMNRSDRARENNVRTSPGNGNRGTQPRSNGGGRNRSTENRSQGPGVNTSPRNTNRGEAQPQRQSPQPRQNAPQQRERAQPRQQVNPQPRQVNPEPRQQRAEPQPRQQMNPQRPAERSSPSPGMNRGNGGGNRPSGGGNRPR